MASTMVYGIRHDVYNTLLELGLDLSSWFSATTTADENGKLFHAFIGTGANGTSDAWNEFLMESGIDEDLWDDYGIGQFAVIRSTQGTGGL